MKTPKRYQNKPLPMLPEDNVVDDWVIEVWCARAKRKNKIKQLKRTIERLRVENFELKMELGIPTHISFEEYNSRYVDFIKPDLISDF